MAPNVQPPQHDSRIITDIVRDADGWPILHKGINIKGRGASTYQVRIIQGVWKQNAIHVTVGAMVVTYNIRASLTLSHYSFSNETL